MLVGTSLRTSATLLLPRAVFAVPFSGACIVFAVCEPAGVFMCVFCAGVPMLRFSAAVLPPKFGRDILLFAAPPTFAVWLVSAPPKAFMLPCCAVAWLAVSRFAGLLKLLAPPRLAVTTLRLKAEAGGVLCACAAPPITDWRVGVAFTPLNTLPLPSAEAGTAPPARLIAAPEVNADFGAAVTAPAVLRKP